MCRTSEPEPTQGRLKLNDNQVQLRQAAEILGSALAFGMLERQELCDMMDRNGITIVGLSHSERRADLVWQTLEQYHLFLKTGVRSGDEVALEACTALICGCTAELWQICMGHGFWAALELGQLSTKEQLHKYQLT